MICVWSESSSSSFAIRLWSIDVWMWVYVCVFNVTVLCLVLGFRGRSEMINKRRGKESSMERRFVIIHPSCDLSFLVLLSFHISSLFTIISPMSPPLTRFSTHASLVTAFSYLVFLLSWFCRKTISLLSNVLCHKWLSSCRHFLLILVKFKFITRIEHIFVTYGKLHKFWHWKMNNIFW